jgi:hypothetical protein
MVAAPTVGPEHPLEVLGGVGGKVGGQRAEAHPSPPPRFSSRLAIDASVGTIVAIRFVGGGESLRALSTHRLARRRGTN